MEGRFLIQTTAERCGHIRFPQHNPGPLPVSGLSNLHWCLPCTVAVTTPGVDVTSSEAIACTRSLPHHCLPLPGSLTQDSISPRAFVHCQSCCWKCLSSGLEKYSVVLTTQSGTYWVLYRLLPWARSLLYWGTRLVQAEINCPALWLLLGNLGQVAFIASPI